jgi:transposase
MLGTPLNTRVFLCTQDTDMRKSFDSLRGIIRGAMHLDPLSGSLFIFKNKRGDRIKCVYWDETGFAMWYKALQRGTFQFPNLQNLSSAGLEIDASTMHMILDGIDLSSIRRRPRFRRTPPTSPSTEQPRNSLEVPLSLLGKSPDTSNHDHETP